MRGQSSRRGSCAGHSARPRQKRIDTRAWRDGGCLNGQGRRAGGKVHVAIDLKWRQRGAGRKGAKIKIQPGAAAPRGKASVSPLLRRVRDGNSEDTTGGVVHGVSITDPTKQWTCAGLTS